MYFIRTINFQKISALGLLVRFFERARKGSDTTKPGWARALVNLKILMRDEMVYTFLTSGEIISHNTVVWTGDVNLEYKIVLVPVLWAVISTKL